VNEVMIGSGLGFEAVVELAEAMVWWWVWQWVIDL
jgi:hypothetical protein